MRTYLVPNSRNSQRPTCSFENRNALVPQLDNRTDQYTLRGVNRGVCKSADPCLFFAKSVDPPKFLFKSETTTTSENRSVEVQSLTGTCECHCYLYSKEGNMLDDKIIFRPRLKKYLWFKFRLGLEIQTYDRHNPESASKNYSWSTIHWVFKIRESARFTPQIHNSCAF